MLEKQISQMKDLFGTADSTKSEGPTVNVRRFPLSTSTNADRKRKKAKRQQRKASRRRG